MYECILNYFSTIYVRLLQPEISINVTDMLTSVTYVMGLK